MLEKVEIHLPLFNGFYGTLFEPDNEIYEYGHSEDLTDEQIDELYESFDNNEYEQTVSIEAVKAIQDAIKSLLKIDCTITYKGLDSPKFYNYRNDSIDAEIELNIDELVALVKKHFEPIDEKIRKDYKSRDGFIPFHDNDLDSWLKDIENGDDLEHHVGSLIGYLLLEHDYDNLSLYYDVFDSVSIFEFLELA